MFLSATAVLVTLLNTLIIAAVFVGIIALEVWLSRRRSRWPGLILPAVTLVLSLLMVLGFAAFSRSGATSTVQVIDEETGAPFTAHTTNPVPFILVNYDPAYTLREGGCLADIAPTLIEMMGMEQPAEMTGKSLLIKK